VKALGQAFAAFGFIVCLQAMTWACSTRSPAAASIPDAPAPPPAPPTAPEIVSEPPAAATPSLAPRTEVESDLSAVALAKEDDCALIASPGEPITVVALGEHVDAENAPRPTNPSERLLFRQLYETLIRVDCSGRPRPGLAASWRRDSDDKAWIVTLRNDARFTDGTPVTAADVRASWMDDGGTELRPEVSRLAQSIVAITEQSLAITLLRQDTIAPVAFAHPDLAISKPVADSPWPLGTRSRRVAAESPASAITLVSDDDPPIRFLVAPGDARDLLDQGVDLLLTRDRAALNYATTLPPFQSLPLAWRRTHVLLTPGRARSSPSLSDQARQALAVDAVRGEARGAQGPFWWQSNPDCQVAASPQQSRPAPAPRIVYDAADAAARDLAERVVGLSRASGPAATAFLDALVPDRPKRLFQRATGLTGEELARTVRRGLDAAYVLSVESQPVDACGELAALVDRAPWLDPATVVPLVDTRLHAIVRRGRAGLSVDWDGGIVIATPTGRKQQ
jgi:hypothetical protein